MQLLQSSCRIGVIVVGGLVISDCRAAHDSNAIAASTPRTETCTSDSGALGFAEPQEAYTRYAEALNSARWCDAIRAFAPAARIEVLVSSFKGFLLLAGTENGRRSAYASRLAAFCRKHGLDYAEPQRLLTLSVDLMNRRDISDALSTFRDAASRGPENMYVEIMNHLAQVNTERTDQLATTMSDIEVVGDSASGTASTTGGRKQKMSFVNTQNGWLLASR